MVHGIQFYTWCERARGLKDKETKKKKIIKEEKSIKKKVLIFSRHIFIAVNCIISGALYLANPPTAKNETSTPDTHETRTWTIFMISRHISSRDVIERPRDFIEKLRARVAQRVERVRVKGGDAWQLRFLFCTWLCDTVSSWVSLSYSIFFALHAWRSSCTEAFYLLFLGKSTFLSDLQRRKSEGCCRSSNYHALCFSGGAMIFFLSVRDLYLASLVLLSLDSFLSIFFSFIDNWSVESHELLLRF